MFLQRIIFEAKRDCNIKKKTDKFLSRLFSYELLILFVILAEFRCESTDIRIQWICRLQERKFYTWAIYYMSRIVDYLSEARKKSRSDK